MNKGTKAEAKETMPFSDEELDQISQRVKSMLTSENPGFVQRVLCDERHRNLKESLEDAKKMLKGLYVFIGLVFIEGTAALLLTLLGSLNGS